MHFTNYLSLNISSFKVLIPFTNGKLKKSFRNCICDEATKIEKLTRGGITRIAVPSPIRSLARGSASSAAENYSIIIPRARARTNRLRQVRSRSSAAAHLHFHATKCLRSSGIPGRAPMKIRSFACIYTRRLIIPKVKGKRERRSGGRIPSPLVLKSMATRKFMYQEGGARPRLDAPNKFSSTAADVSADADIRCDFDFESSSACFLGRCVAVA